MAERGAVPKVSSVRRKVLRAVRTLFTPLMPDDYLEMINPLWSTAGAARAGSSSIERRTEDAVTIVIKPGADWEGHKPGQYLRVGRDRRRRPPLARLLAHLRPGPLGRLHLASPRSS